MKVFFFEMRSCASIAQRIKSGSSVCMSEPNPRSPSALLMACSGLTYRGMLIGILFFVFFCVPFSYRTTLAWHCCRPINQTPTHRTLLYLYSKLVNYQSLLFTGITFFSSLNLYFFTYEISFQRIKQCINHIIVRHTLSSCLLTSC